MPAASPELDTISAPVRSSTMSQTPGGVGTFCKSADTGCSIVVIFLKLELDLKLV